jgi:hypothetical protein
MATLAAEHSRNALAMRNFSAGFRAHRSLKGNGLLQRNLSLFSSII